MEQWDPRLITPEQALGLTGDERLFLDYTGDEVHIRHGDCSQSVGVFWSLRTGIVTTPADIVSATLRHMVMAHDLPLNRGAGKDG
jgi:hypothetical protein